MYARAMLVDRVARSYAGSAQTRFVLSSGLQVVALKSPAPQVGTVVFVFGSIETRPVPTLRALTVIDVGSDPAASPAVHASPREHDVARHVRVLRDGRTIVVRAHKRGRKNTIR